jgi:hypothetical protein
MFYQNHPLNMQRLLLRYFLFFKDQLFMARLTNQESIALYTRTLF